MALTFCQLRCAICILAALDREDKARSFWQPQVTIAVVGGCSLVLETDPNVIANRVSMRGADSDLPLAEQVRPSFVCRAEFISNAEASRHQIATPHTMHWAGQELIACRGGIVDLPHGQLTSSRCFPGGMMPLHSPI